MRKIRRVAKFLLETHLWPAFRSEIVDPLITAIALVVLGLIVVILELFIPSAGVLGILAGVLLISGIVTGFMESAVTGTVLLLVVAFTLPLLLAALIKIWPSTPIGRRILVPPPKQEDVLPVGDYLDELRGQIGKIAIAKTKMLPSGIILLDHQHYDAICEGFAIEAGERVKVIAVRSNRLYVQPYNPAEDATTDFSHPSLLERSLDELGLGSENLGETGT